MNRSLFYVVFLLVLIENSYCWRRKSTYCPNAEPMAGFEWKSVRININNYYSN